MENEFQVECIETNGDIILPEKEFTKFVNRNELPIFKYKYETSHKTETWITETTFTVFHGANICLKTKITHMPLKP